MTGDSGSRKPRLAILWTAQLYKDDTGYTTDSYQHYQFPALVDWFDVDLIAPVTDAGGTPHSEIVDSEHLRIIPLAFAGTSWWRLYAVGFPSLCWQIAHTIWRNRANWDLILAIDPDIYSQVCLLVCQALAIPYVLFIGGSYDYAVLMRDKLARQSGRLWLILATLWARWLSIAERVLASRVPTVVTGTELFERYARRNRNLLNYVS